MVQQLQKLRHFIHLPIHFVAKTIELHNLRFMPKLNKALYPFQMRTMSLLVLIQTTWQTQRSLLDDT